MGFFERYLTVWVGLCILVGIAFGELTALTLIINWLIKPFTMAFFAWIFLTNYLQPIFRQN